MAFLTRIFHKWAGKSKLPVFYSVLSGLLLGAALVSGSTGYGNSLIFISFVPLIYVLCKTSFNSCAAFTITCITGLGIYMALLCIQPWMYSVAFLLPLCIAGLTALIWHISTLLFSPQLQALVMILYTISLDWIIGSTPITSVISPSCSLSDSVFLAPAGIAGFPFVTGMIITVNILLYALLFSREKNTMIPSLIAGILIILCFVVSLIQPSRQYNADSVNISALDAGMYPHGYNAPSPHLQNERKHLGSNTGLYHTLISETPGIITVLPELFYTKKPSPNSFALTNDKTIIIPFESNSKNSAVPLTSSGFKRPYIKNNPAEVMGEDHTAGTEQPIYTTDRAWDYGLLICFDMSFEKYSRNLVSKGADIILVCGTSRSLFNSRNWVKRSASIRAVESGVPIAVSTDIGAYIVNSKGMVVKSTSGKSPAVITAQVTPNPVVTLYVKGGYRIPSCAFFLLCLILIIGLYHRLSEKNSRSHSSRHSIESFPS